MKALSVLIGAVPLPYFLPQAFNQQKTIQYSREVNITYTTAKLFPEENVTEFSGSVVATFGVSKVTADKVRVYYAEDARYAQFIGHAHLDDPDGTVDADSIYFNWREHVAQAFNSKIWTLGLKVNAKDVRITPTKWNLEGVDFTTCNRDLPFYQIGAARIVVEPGNKATLYRAYTKVLGTKLLTLPKQRFSLDSRSTGLKMPLPTYRRDLGFGIRTDSVYGIGHQSGISGYLASFKKSTPSYSLYYSKSFVPVGTAQGYLASRSGLQERITNGYLVNVSVESLDREHELNSVRRNLFSVGASVNEVAFGRDSSSAYYTKPVELQYELGCETKEHFATNVKVRLNSMRRLQSAYAQRGELDGFATSPAWSIGNNLKVLGRLDLGGVASTVPSSWAQATAGFQYQFSPYFSVGAGYAVGGFWGTPQYPIDTLNHPHQIIVREDLLTGPTRFSLMHKYDPRGRHWFDTEYEARQVIGCLEALVRYRGDVGDYRFGLTLRLDAIADALTKRSLQRPLKMQLDPSSNPAEIRKF